jgi:ketosteroid isomerase-like protein
MNRMRPFSTVLYGALLLSLATAFVGGRDLAAQTAADSAAVATVVHAFHGALERGDSATALGLLTEDATILESGGVETKEEYRSHHLPSDIAFARAVPRESGPLRIVLRDDVAWASSTSTMEGTYRERPVNSQGAELMVLVRTAEGWRIAAIHWSSRTRRP